MKIINAIGNDVLSVRKLGGGAEVYDSCEILLIAQFFCGFLIDLAEVSASVKLSVANGFAVCRGNTAQIAQIFNSFCLFALLLIW